MAARTLRGKKCFITGAASGIGRATAIAAAGEGALLFLTDRDQGQLDETVAEIQRSGGSVQASRAFDIADFDAVSAFAADIHAEHGSLDVVMNIAGISLWGTVDSLQHHHWRKVIEVNLMGPIHVIESFVPAMMAAGRGGHLVNVSSAAGLFGLPWHAAYSASKFGLRGISEVLRFDLERHGIGVSLVCPGGVDTPLTKTVEILGVDTTTRAAGKLRANFKRHAVTPEVAARAILKGIQRKEYMVFTSSDIRIGYWFQRKLSFGYELAMRRLNDQLHRLKPALLVALCFAAACGDDATTAAVDPSGDAGMVGDAAAPDDAGGDAGTGGEDLGPLGSSLEVMTRSGVVRGKLDGATRAFLGIPYAEPPVGELRWRSPQPAEPWAGERDATAYGAPCMQPLFPGTSEDCLFLNVWAPDVAAGESAPLKPTMVWLHGGAFLSGDGALYDGTHLAERGDVVLVSINYRLGAFGFLAHPALSQDPEGRGSSGNYGIEDQALALEWVKQNIVAFGGDPDNVTLFGESAGSACTCVLLGAPAAQGLVDHAIMQSGACLGFESTLADAEARGELSVAPLGCDGADTLACLRGTSAQQIVDATSDVLGALVNQRWRPIVDGVVVPVVEDIQPVKVPIIIGTNRNEGGLFGALAGTETAFRSRVAQYYPSDEDADRILAAYNDEAYGSWAEAFSALVTDSLFVCPTRRLARAAAAEDVPTYLYSFSHGQAFHADDVPYVFGLPTLSDEAQGVSDEMLDAWTTFARTGDPNGGERIAWPRYDAERDEHMVFDVESSVGSGLKQEACDLLDTLPPLQF